MMSGTPVVASPTLLQALHRSNHAKSPLANASFIDGDIDGSVSVSSPVTEVFSTPPSSPFPVNPANTPTTAHVGGAFALKSPPAARSIGKALASSSLARVEITNTNGESEQNNFAAIDMASPSQTHPTQTLSLPNNNQPSRRGDASVPVSPFFVHSLLDQGASYRSFLEQNHIPSPLVSTHAQAASASRSNTMSTTSSSSSSPSDPHYQSSGGVGGAPNSGPGSSIPATTMGGSSGTEYASSNHSATAIESDYSLSEFDDDEGNDGNSLTKQLAETAVGVRELAKQLGRARVRTNIQNVLIITKARDNRLIKLTRELAIYLMMKKSPETGRGLTVYVDNQLRKSKRFDAAGIAHDYPEFFLPAPRRRSSAGAASGAAKFANSGFGFTDLNGNQASKAPTRTASMSSTGTASGPGGEEGQLRYWTADMCTKNAHLFDFVVTLGGDGTVLFTSWLFQRIVPPVLPFALGSLGFLTNFDFADYAPVMDSAIDNGIRVNLRMRFTCTVYRAVAPEEGKGSKAVKKADTGEILMRNVEKGGWEALEGGGAGGHIPAPTTGKEKGKKKKDKEIMCFTTRPVETFEVLNELVVDRGPSPYMSLLELFGDEHHMTTVQADGLTVSTPTGSTAYSLSAGGSLVHPEIPSLLITPICPHTLSFRPMLLPDSMELRICVPYNSRSTAWASFDGRGRVELKQGDHIKVTASKYPFPTVCADKQSTDWFHAIGRTLKWNERERQKSFVVVEEGPARPKKKKAASPEGSTTPDIPPVPASTAAIPPAGAPVAVGGEEAEDDDEEDEEEEEEEEEEDKFDIDIEPEDPNKGKDESALSSSTSSLSSSGVGLPAANAKATTDLVSPLASTNGAGTPDRFKTVKPQPPPLASRHMISDAARKVLDLELEEEEGQTPRGAHHPHHGHSHHPHPHSNLNPTSPAALRQHEDEDGERDYIRAPESLMSSSRSKIPRDRDVEGDSMLSARTPRAAEDPDRDDSGSATVSGQQRGSPKRNRTRSSGPRRHDDAYNHHYPVPPHSAAPSSSGQPWIHSHFLHPPTTGHSHPPSTNAHGRNHRRHGSVDSLPVNAPAQRRAFAAWGRDESDSNASDSDA